MPFVVLATEFRDDPVDIQWISYRNACPHKEMLVTSNGQIKSVHRKVRFKVRLINSLGPAF